MQLPIAPVALLAVLIFAFASASESESHRGQSGSPKDETTSLTSTSTSSSSSAASHSLPSTLSSIPVPGLSTISSQPQSSPSSSSTSSDHDPTGVSSNVKSKEDSEDGSHSETSSSASSASTTAIFTNAGPKLHVTTIAIIAVAAVLGTTVVIVGSFLLYRWRSRKIRTHDGEQEHGHPDGGDSASTRRLMIQPQDGCASTTASFHSHSLALDNQPPSLSPVYTVTSLPHSIIESLPVGSGKSPSDPSTPNSTSGKFETVPVSFVPPPSEAGTQMQEVDGGVSLMYSNHDRTVTVPPPYTEYSTSDDGRSSTTG